jgi:hypothetical protein
MADIIKNMQTPSIDQLSKPSREIFYKEHEFQPDIAVILQELDTLLNEESGSSSIITQEKNETALLLSRQIAKVNEVSSEVSEKIALLLEKLIEIDSIYELLYNKISDTIRALNVNLHNKTQIYDIPSSYFSKLKNAVIDRYGRKSPYNEHKTSALDMGNRWSIRNPHSIIMLRDVNPSCCFRTYPAVIDPAIPQASYIKIASFTPLVNGAAPVFLAELIISGDSYAFKGYIKSAFIDKHGNRGAVFDAEYAVSYEVPFSFKVIYDNELNKIMILYKLDEIAGSYTSIVKLDFSINVLVGKDLVFEKNNTLFTEELTA